MRLRQLKAKKGLPNITAESAKLLMQEIYNFEVDLGELGIEPASENGYRYLRAYVTS